MKLFFFLGLSVLLSYGVAEAKIEVGDGPDGNVTAVEVWADQKSKHKPGDTWPKGDGCNTCEMDQYRTSYCTTLYCRDRADCLRTGSDGTVYDICNKFKDEPLPRELVTCDPDMTKCETPCERKMKEAMKAMDKIMRDEWVHTPYGTYEYQSMVPNAQERELWKKVMKECVRP